MSHNQGVDEDPAINSDEHYTQPLEKCPEEAFLTDEPEEDQPVAYEKDEPVNDTDSDSDEEEKESYTQIGEHLDERIK